jgi:hypothetical protein
MHARLLTTLFSLLAISGIATSPAFANEFLYEEQTKVKPVPVGTNFMTEQVGNIKLVSAGVTVECERSAIVGTLTANKATAPEETPKAEVQSVIFARCNETTGAKGKVVVRTKTNPIWKLEWTAGKTLALTAISATIELQGKGVTCTMKNKGGSAFNAIWKNAVLSEAEITEQLLTVEGGGACPTEFKETGKYKLSSGFVGDVSEKMFLE